MPPQQLNRQILVFLAQIYLLVFPLDLWVLTRPVGQQARFVTEPLFRQLGIISINMKLNPTSPFNS